MSIESPKTDVSLEALRRQKKIVERIAAAHGAYNLRVFGSLARGEATETSDIDLLVDMDPDRSLLDLGGLLMDLRELLGRDLDIVTEAGLRKRIRTRVLEEAVPL